jgi:ABC-type antimicrobial peptide transport system permease subunit
MFALETSVISVLFGGSGIVFGALVVLLLNALNIRAESQADFLTMIFGGDKYHPMLSIGTIVLGIFELGVVSVLAMIFPIRLAKKITPLDAISRE